MAFVAKKSEEVTAPKVDEKVKGQTKPEPKTESKTKTETKVEPKTDVKPEPEIKAEPKVLEAINVPSAPTTSTEVPSVPESNDAKLVEKEKISKLGIDELWSHFGGENIRGNVSRVIRHMNALGFTRADIAKLTGKRYQHVRNVLTEDAKVADRKAVTK